MKFSLKDELGLLLELRNESFPQELPEVRAADDTKVRMLAQAALARLHGSRLAAGQAPEDIRPSQVWQTRSYDPDFPSGPFGPRTFILTDVIKENDHFEIMGVPISEDWRFSTPSDLVVGPGGGLPSPYDEWTMIELRLETFLPREALARFVGEVSDELFAQIQSLLSWKDGEEVERTFVGIEYLSADHRTVVGPPLEKWAIKDPVSGDQHTVLMGQQIVGKDDPRLEYKKRSLDDQNYLVLPEVRREKEPWDETTKRSQSEHDIKEILAKLSKIEKQGEDLRRLQDDVWLIKNLLHTLADQIAKDKFSEDVDSVPSEVIENNVINIRSYSNAKSRK